MPTILEEYQRLGLRGAGLEKLPEIESRATEGQSLSTILHPLGVAGQDPNYQSIVRSELQQKLDTINQLRAAGINLSFPALAARLKNSPFASLAAGFEATSDVGALTPQPAPAGAFNIPQLATGELLQRGRALADTGAQLEAARKQIADIARGTAEVATKAGRTDILNIGRNVLGGLQTLPPPAVDVSSGVNSSLAAAGGLIGQTEDLTKSLESLFGERITELEKKRGGFLQKFLGTKRPSLEELRAEAFGVLGLPESFTKESFSQLTSLTSEITALTTELNALKVQEQNEMLATRAQTVPSGIIAGEQAAIERRYALKKSALAADISAKAAAAQMLRGNLQLAEGLIENAINLAVADFRQEKEDMRFLINEYNEEIRGLRDDERQIVFKIMDLLEKRETQVYQDLQDKYKIIMGAADNKIDIAAGMSIEDIKNTPIATFVERYAARVSAKKAEASLETVPWSISAAQAGLVGLPVQWAKDLLSSDIAAPWYKPQLEKAARMSLTPEFVQSQWETARQKIKSQLKQTGFAALLEELRTPPPAEEGNF